MSVATLIIGLGGTGTLTIRALKKLYQELPENERVPASLLAFDFDRSALLSGDQSFRFAPLSEDEFFYLNPKALQELLRNLDRGDNGDLAWQRVLRWFPDRTHVQIPASEVEANGASQLRVLGRLGFFLNDEVIERAIRLKLNDLGGEVDPSRLAEDKRVIIVSSIAGGTGAGMLIDMAYVVRRQLLRPRVFAYVLLPEVFQDVDSGGRIFQNSYASIRELAYLKDQQIPFEAEYERIPPINIPVAGEEPFSRIFLCRGDGFAGAESIKDATFLIAQSILGQLQRAIQEKTLAIASNTLSADPTAEQKKRRTHCFSTVSSSIIELEKVDVRKAIFQKIVEILKEGEQLEDLYRDNLAAVFELVGQEFVSPSEKRGAPPPKDADSVAAEHEAEVIPEARRLVMEWEEAVEEDARDTEKALTPQLLAAVNRVEATVRAGHEETDLSEARKTLDTIKQMTPAALAQGSAAELSLGVLPEAQNTLDDFDRKSLSLLTPLGPEASPSTEQSLKRKAQYAQLARRLKEILAAAPPQELPPAVRRLEDTWQARATSLDRPSFAFPKGLRTAYTDDVQRLLSDCADLRAFFEDKLTQAEVSAFLQRRAQSKLLSRLEEFQTKVNTTLGANLRPWTERKHESGAIQQTFENLGHLRPRVISWIRENLPGILDETREISAAQDDAPEKRRERLDEILTARLKKVPELQGPHYVFKMKPEEVEDFIRERLVRTRQQVFERRTPNPQRKAISLLMIPQGLIWPMGSRKDLRRFLEASASQILAARAQIEDYEGSRIWSYYEDLFNPPEHVRNIDEYYRTYSSQEFKELFHIDRRFLENSDFKEVHSQRAMINVVCGNPGCRENISGHPRTERICPGCSRMIRTRCGNDGCMENALNQHPKGKEKNCPVCNGFNYAAWWCCTKHGKIPIEVPIDKERCPRCIELHQEDPIAYPKSWISERPDVKENPPCPHCAVLAEKDSKYEVFRIPRRLRRFYWDGVNGHDREEFLRASRDCHLPQNVRCPKCRTILIPIHHQKTPLGCGGRPVQ
jgi:hypothetical protein